MKRPLISLGEGVYTVAEVCRILQPSMTPRRVHYWLDTGLLSEPLARGHRGSPTLLSFQQLLEIRTVQRLRDELAFSLPVVRSAFAWILKALFDAHWSDLRFERHGTDLVAVAGDDRIVVPGGQCVLDLEIPKLNVELADTRSAWEAGAFAIPGHPFVISSAGVQAGSPTVKGTRVETAMLAAFADDGVVDESTLADVRRLYRHLPTGAVEDALAFEGVRIAS